MEVDPDEKPILIVGSNIRFLAENGVRHGHNVATVDYYGDWDTPKNIFSSRSVRHDGNGVFELKQLIELSKGIEYKSVIYGSGFENNILELSKLKEVGHISGCDIESVRKAKDPEVLARSARSWNFKYPDTRYDKNINMKDGEWLLKPLAGLGGIGITFTNDTTSNIESGCYYQKYVEGLPSSAAVVSNGTAASLIGVSTQIVGDPSFGSDKFRFVGNIFPHPFAKEIIQPVTAIAESLTLELDIKGLWGFDFIYDGDITLIEINPRPTASLSVISSATWNDLIKLHIDSVSATDSNAILDPGPTGVYFGESRVFAKEGGTFSDPDYWKRRGAKDIPHDGEFIEKGEPVLTVCASGANYGNVLAKLRSEAESVYASLSTKATPLL